MSLIFYLLILLFINFFNLANFFVLLIILFYYKMGGHGGLNILPQKKWNVYNYDNRAIVDKDKKEAADKKRQEF